MYSRSAGVARSYLLPKKPTASSPAATGLATVTSAAVTGLAAATSQVTLPQACTKSGYPSAATERASRAGAEPADPRVPEQPLGIPLAGGQHGGKVRQPGPDHDQRPAGLRQLMAGRTERRDVGRGHVLHLVHEERDAHREVGGDRGRVGQQFGQVDLEVTGIGPAM